MSEKVELQLKRISKFFKIPFALVRMDYKEKLKWTNNNVQEALDWVVGDYAEASIS